MINLSKLFFLIYLSSLATASYSREPSPQDQLITRGQYLTDIAGCKYCHTADDGGEFAGGRVSASGYGDFYSPNISSDNNAGIGLWSLEDFKQAITLGISPEGQHYYPVFPYPSYQNLTAYDVEAIYRYLLTTEPHKTTPKEHDINFPFSMRSLLFLWKWLYMEDGKIPKGTLSDEHKNGQYLVYAITHCDQCHSPRSAIGGVDTDKRLSGGNYKNDSSYAPSILKSKNGLDGWDVDDLETYLLLGEEPDGDYVGGDMVEVIDHMTNYLTDDDLKQLANFLLLPQ